MNINYKDKNTLLLIGILAAVSIVALISAFTYLNQGNSIEVPDFKDKTVQDVKLWIDEHKLDDDVEILYQYDEEVEENIVISQSIEALETLENGEKLTISISKGADPELLVMFPTFTEMSKDEIIKFFENNKFSDVTYEYVVSDTIPKDTFIKINIDDTQARRSDLIVITISIGNENIGVEITMPDFKDSSQENIKAWANTNNITVTFVTETSTTVESGKVISQSIEAGETITTGSKLEIVLSGGKGIEIPDLKGKTQEEVEAWAKENNANVDLINYYADSTEKGKVISTTPGSGTLASSATLRVYISLGSVVIPDFTDEKEEDVKKWIETTNKSIYSKDNYISYEVKKDTNSTKDIGTIISTNPSKNSEVKLGSTITITVVDKESVQVDSKSNVTVSSLRTYVEGLDMVLGSATKTLYHDTIASGYVISSDSGLKTVGTTINYTTSKGKFIPGTYTSLSSCQSAINKAHSEGASGYSCVVSKEEYSNTVATGSVISQSISGKTINLVISKGKQINVVSYAGKTESEFITYLNTNNLVRGTRSEAYSDTIAVGSIISNDTGNKPEGSKINYVVSKGREPISVVSYVNQSEQTFLDFLKSNGLTAGVRTEVYHSSIAAGLLISNDTGSFAFGNTVNYTVSLGVQPPQEYLIAVNLADYEVINNPDQSKANILNYLSNTLGIPSDYINISIVASERTSGELIEYPAAGSKISPTKDKPVVVKISNGQS